MQKTVSIKGIIAKLKATAVQINEDIFNLRLNYEMRMSVVDIIYTFVFTIIETIKEKIKRKVLSEKG